MTINREKVERITDTLVEWSKGNTAGLPMTRRDIVCAVITIEANDLSNNEKEIEDIMEDWSDGRGYLVRASDIIAAFKI